MPRPFLNSIFLKRVQISFSKPVVGIPKQLLNSTKPLERLSIFSPPKPRIPHPLGSPNSLTLATISILEGSFTTFLERSNKPPSCNSILSDWQLGLWEPKERRRPRKTRKIHTWSQAISSSLIWSFYQGCKEVWFPMLVLSHFICKTHSWGKNCHYHRLCGWHNPNWRSWERIRQTQEFSYPWVQN